MGKTSFSELLGSLDPDPHIRGKQFERLTKWWLSHTPVMPFAPLTITKLWLWDEWPDRPGPDIGIDLVVELSDGSLVAIQSKCFDENADIPKSQLDSFISAASTKVYSHRLLIATTDGLSANARRMLRDQHVICVMRSKLEASLTAWPASIDDLATPLTQTKWQPLPHQKEAIDNVTNGLATGDRGQMIMACGTGKTLTALWVTEALNPTTTLVLVPSLNLLSQTLNEWARHTNIPWTYICVCSDETVNKSNDEPIATVADFPFEVTTDSNRIANFLATPGRKVVFSTYQSSAQIARALQTTPTVIDLAICDEAHRLTGKTDAGYATILDNTKIPVAKRLFMTATPRTYTPIVRKKAEERGVEVTSMDDQNVYGPVLHKLSFGDAINRGLLSDYKVVIVGVTDPQVQDLIDRRELVTVNKDVDTDARTLAAHIGLAKATKEYNLSRIISFHSRINTAAKFAQDHPKILDWLPDTHSPGGTTWTETISGAMNTGKRRQLLNQLRIDQPGRHALLTNARCLTEGVDVPTLDGVAFIDPRSSQVDIIQAVGRAIRKSDNKKTGIIVLPILIPTNVDVENAFEDSAFKPIWAILNSLKAHDEDLSLRLSELRVVIGQSAATGQLLDDLTIRLPIDIDCSIPHFAQKLTVGIIEHSTSTWDHMYGHLVEYANTHGHARPPARKVGRDWFSQWVADQRVAFKAGELDNRRRSLLESLPGWTWDPLGESWNDFFEVLRKFVAEHGHANVPAKPKLYQGVGLGSWVNHQRTKFKKGELDKDKIGFLETVDKWTWAPKDDQYQNSYKAVEDYARANGHSRPPRDLTVMRDGLEVRLATWITTRRREFLIGDLSQERITQLEALPGWTWNPIDEDWEQWFQLLVKFVSEFGHARVPQKSTYQGKSLAAWVNSQRKRHADATLEEDRVKRLEGLNGWSWRPQDDAWEKQFRGLESEVKASGAVNTISSMPQGLISWIHSQKIKFREGRLTPELIRRLESLNGWSWDIRDIRIEQRETYFKMLRSYVTEHGHASPPRSTVIDGIKLGEWTKAQRHAFHQGDIPRDLVEQFEALPGWTWEPFDDQWNKTFASICALLEQNGGVVPPTMPTKELATWVTRQRKTFASGKLPPDRVEKLSQLRGWTWSFVEIKDAKWEAMFALLNTYVEEHGTARVRDKAIYKGHKLGTWVSVQRRRFAEGTITAQQQDHLLSLLDWSWNPIEDDWHETFRRMEQFVSENGHAKPRGHIKAEAELAQWVGVQRNSYKSGKIPQPRIALLERLAGWQWSVRSDTQREQDWERHFAVVSQYIKRTGTTRATKDHREDGINISWWMQKQRKAHADGTLATDLIERLNTLSGWSWDVFSDAWELRFEKTEKFIAREGHARVPQRYTEDGVEIGSWVATQRAKFNLRTLDPHRIARLNSLPGWTWDPIGDDWEERCRLLDRFVSKNGHANVPDKHQEENFPLGKWVGKQRQAKKNNRLTADRARRLEAFPGWKWTQRSDPR